MKMHRIRNAAIFAAILMVTTASSEPRTTKRIAPVSAHASVVRTLLTTPQTQMTIQPAHESIDDSVTAADAMLMFVSGAGILALQLRRKQKQLRSARLTVPTT
jgi:hypothetical protein